MGDWRMQGMAVRRRMGAPSSTYLAAGGSDMRDEVSTALAGAHQEGREPMGMDFIAQASQPRIASSFAHPELIRAKMNTQAGDPALVPGMQPRNPVAAERLGAHFAPTIGIRGPVLPEAAATQANGRIVPPRIVRSMDSFGQGIATSMK